MEQVVTVGCRIPHGRQATRLGVLDAIRDAVRTVKEGHPHLARSSLKDIALKRRGDEIRVTLYFSATPTP